MDDLKEKTLNCQWGNYQGEPTRYILKDTSNLQSLLRIKNTNSLSQDYNIKTPQLPEGFLF